MPHRYLRRPDRPVVAVRIALDTDGLTYQKWGAEQRAKADDWIVDQRGCLHRGCRGVRANLPADRSRHLCEDNTRVGRKGQGCGLR